MNASASGEKHIISEDSEKNIISIFIYPLQDDQMRILLKDPSVKLDEGGTGSW